MARKISLDDYENKIKDDEQLITKPKEKRKSKLPLILSLALILCSLVCIVFLIIYYKSDVTKYKDEIFKLEKQLATKDEIIDSYKYDLNKLTGNNTIQYMEKKLNFFDNNIVFRIEGFGDYYYTYDCMLKKVNGSFSYWAYNRERAISEGLREGRC